MRIYTQYMLAIIITTPSLILLLGIHTAIPFILANSETQVLSPSPTRRKSCSHSTLYIQSHNITNVMIYLSVSPTRL